MKPTTTNLFMIALIKRSRDSSETKKNPNSINGADK